MKEELESKDSNIQDLTTNQNNLRMALDHTVNISVVQQDEINNLLRDNMSLYDETVQLSHRQDQLTNDRGRLEDDVRQLRSDNNSKDKTLKQQVRVISCIRRDVASMGETIEQRTAQCVELKTKNVQLCKDNRQLKTENTQLQTNNTQLQTVCYLSVVVILCHLSVCFLSVVVCCLSVVVCYLSVVVILCHLSVCFLSVVVCCLYN
jgi:chromosome segregation ATPase